MKNTHTLKSLLFGLIILFGSNQVSASLIGDEVLFQTRTGGILSTPIPLLVTSSFELASGLPFGAAIIDIAAESITFAVTNNATMTSFPGLEQHIFSDLDWVGSSGVITGVNLLQTGFQGPPIAINSFTSDSVTVDLAGIFLSSATSISGSYTLELTVEHGPMEAALPSVLLLLLTGLGALGVHTSRPARQKG